MKIVAEQRAATGGATTVSDAMTVGLISCPPEAPLRSVAKLMTTHGVHAVFVFDYGDEADETVELWGLVSDLDLVAAWAGAVERTARSASVAPLVTVTSDDTLQDAARLMAERGTAHLAVLDPTTRRPAGVISTLDIARVISDAPTPSP